MSYEVQPEFPPAPQLQVYGDAPEQTSELDEHHDDGAYDVDDQPCADEDEYQIKLRACAGPNWLWRWRCSVSRWRAQPPHSATAL